MQFDFLSVLVVFVFKLLLSFFWLCKEAQCVYLHLHLGRKLWSSAFNSFVYHFTFYNLLTLSISSANLTTSLFINIVFLIGWKSELELGAVPTLYQHKG